MILSRKLSTYVGLVLGGYLLFGLLIALNGLFLLRTNELVPLDTIVKSQQKNNTVYNALSYSLADYKYAGYRQRPPTIVAIGSSRAIPIRDYFFSKSFYNLGGLVRAPSQAFPLADHLFRHHKPSVVIYNADFWSFCTLKPEYPPFKRPTAKTHAGEGKPKRFLVPLQLIAQGRLSLGKYLATLVNGVPEGPDGLRRFGITAALNGTGFLADGSQYRGPETETLDARMAKGLREIAQGEGQFQHHCHLSQEAMAQVEMLHAELARAGIDLIVVAPPVASLIAERMREAGGEYAYVTQWRRAMKKRDIRFFDFHDMAPMGVSDCEFVDAIHGGEMVYARMILAMAKALPTSFGRMVRVGSLERRIAENAGRTVVMDGTDRIRLRGQLIRDAETARSCLRDHPARLAAKQRAMPPMGSAPESNTD